MKSTVLLQVPTIGVDITYLPVFAFGAMIAFSVYLVHVPILGIVSALLTADRQIFVLVIGLPISFIVAIGFFHVVEAPSHRLAKYLSDEVTRRRRSAPAELRSVRSRRPEPSPEDTFVSTVTKH